MDISDEQLFSNFKQGNKHDFEILITRHQTFLKNFINKRVQNIDLADDLFQDTILQIIRKSNNFIEGSFRAWMTTLAANIIHSFYRSNKLVIKVGALMLDDPANENNDDGNVSFINYFPSASNQERDFLVAEEKALIIDQTSKIFPEGMAVLQHRLNDLSFEEISEKENIPAKTAMTRMFRIKTKLKDILQDF